MSKITKTKESSCVNARGIPPTTLQVHAVLFQLGYYPSSRSGPMLGVTHPRSEEGYPIPGQEGRTPFQVRRLVTPSQVRMRALRQPDGGTLMFPEGVPLSERMGVPASGKMGILPLLGRMGVSPCLGLGPGQATPPPGCELTNWKQYLPPSFRRGR